MLYQINEKQLQSINVMIKLINIAIQRNAFNDAETKTIYKKLSDINKLH